MHTDLVVWQMIVDAEREIALSRAARMGAQGASMRRGWRLPRWVRRQTVPSPAPSPTRWGGESGRIVVE